MDRQRADNPAVPRRKLSRELRMPSDAPEGTSAAADAEQACTYRVGRVVCTGRSRGCRQSSSVRQLSCWYSLAQRFQGGEARRDRVWWHEIRSNPAARVRVIPDHQKPARQRSAGADPAHRTTRRVGL